MLYEVITLLMNKNHITCAVTAEAAAFDQISPAMEGFLNRLPSVTPAPPTGASAEFMPQPVCKGWALSAPVNYVGRVFRAVPYTHPDSAALMVLSKLLRAEYLHREIREKGGAYGGLASFSAESGMLSLLSYRDPHLVRTLRVFDDAVQRNNFV